ncbi:DinB family protein [Pedobacter gandavensis]|uniref:DinB family protein n=1 Tax=Pedobacter gandavensis TaxID=2679963 RepID=A0ABR6EX91_9SPHI|nr:DinB family protein [Pedobacter gandavensis]MBB2149859.1 DinB family protein [Pedobacter gandavensis]
MEMIKMFLEELAQEAQTTRKMLAIVPSEKFDWQPHPKSMTVKVLASHIAELPTWITLAVTTDELDFASAPYSPKELKTNADLMKLFEESLQDGTSHLSAAKEEILSEPWILRNGEQIYSTFTKASLIRHVLSQIIHHRAQLGVFLRLLDIPIPGSYGPSADDTSF